jgi:hypothetical protein
LLDERTEIDIEHRRLALAVTHPASTRASDSPDKQAEMGGVTEEGCSIASGSRRRT